MANRKNKKKILVNMLLYSTYIIVAIIELFFLNYNIFFRISGGVFIILVFVRTFILNALKPLNPICHSNGLKYLYQKKNDLAGYEKFEKRNEKILVALGIILLIIGVLMYIA